MPIARCWRARTFPRRPVAKVLFMYHGGGGDHRIAELFGQRGVVVEVRERDLGLDHPELREVVPQVRVPRAVLEERGDDLKFFVERHDKTVITRLEQFLSASFARIEYGEAIDILRSSSTPSNGGPTSRPSTRAPPPSSATSVAPSSS